MCGPRPDPSRPRAVSRTLNAIRLKGATATGHTVARDTPCAKQSVEPRAAQLGAGVLGELGFAGALEQQPQHVAAELLRRPVLLGEVKTEIEQVFRIQPLGLVD